MGPGQPLAYQIRIKGHLGRQWTDWFSGLAITLEDNGDTLLTGLIVDQAALHGLLRKVRDLGMPLISVSSRSQLEEERNHESLHRRSFREARAVHGAARAGPRLRGGWRLP